MGRVITSSAVGGADLHDAWIATPYRSRVLTEFGALEMRTFGDVAALLGTLARDSVRSFSMVPLTLREANAFIREHHRHLDGKPGARFAVGAVRDGELVGVAVVSRPAARMLDDGATAEIARLATNGTRNACSFLLSRVARIVRLMGYKRLITYTLAHELGVSLRAAGWKYEGPTSGGRWSRAGRARVDSNTGIKHRWSAW